MRTRGFVVLVLAALLSVFPHTAAAHGIVAGGAHVLEAQAGKYPLRVEVVVPTGAPSTLSMRIRVLSPSRAGALVRVSAAPTGSAVGTPQEFPMPADADGFVSVTFPVSRTGAWDIGVEIADGSDTGGFLLVPVTIAETVVPPTTLPLFAAFALLAAVLAVQILWLTAPGWVLAISRAGVVAGLTLVLALGSVIATPSLRLEWNTPVPLPRPFFGVQTDSTASELRFSFYDGSTGLVVDDFVPHHQALVHTVCIETTTQALFHLHPARVAPGMYTLDRTLLTPGRYTCIHEAERVASGPQIVQSVVEIPGTSSAVQSFGALNSPIPIGDLTARVTAAGPLTSGAPVSFDVQFRTAAGQSTEITPWLGMRGHLIVQQASGGVYGHVHAVGPMDEQFFPIPQPGGKVSFVYSFPRPGRYHLWFQVLIDAQVHTVPVVVAVEAP